MTPAAAPGTVCPPQPLRPWKIDGRGRGAPGGVFGLHGRQRGGWGGLTVPRGTDCLQGGRNGGQTPLPWHHNRELPDPQCALAPLVHALHARMHTVRASHISAHIPCRPADPVPFFRCSDGRAWLQVTNRTDCATIGATIVPPTKKQGRTAAAGLVRILVASRSSGGKAAVPLPGAFGIV